MAAPPFTLCVQWPRLGPYHRARLEAMHAVLAPHGVRVVALEAAGRDATYGWTDGAPPPYDHVQVFPEATFETLPPRRMYAAVQATLDTIRPDAVATHSYSFADAQACLAWCRTHRRTAIVMTDSKADDGPRAAWRELLKGLIVRQYDAALVAGLPQTAYLTSFQFPADKIWPGYDVVDNAFYHAHAAAARVDRAPHLTAAGLPADLGPFFISVNRLIPLKNLDRLLRAYHAYHHAAEAPWPLVLVGDGPERARLEHQIEAEHIPDVYLTGSQPAERVAALYGCAGALVLATLKDTWGLVVNEAMAAGLPVLVSTRAGCALDLVDEGRTGYAFDPLDTTTLTQLLARVSAPSTDRIAMGRHAQTLIDRFTPEVFARNLWAAAQAGQATRHRGLNPLVGLLLWLLRRPADPQAFHATDV
ncbi:MAG: glycosyltransferase family 4 protein [Bacteroidota bacterium]